ncbi:hypothetical protein [Spiroplasma poulsonii]|uniref:hypothetical protein n=1 Tax=Spiroplasma poulsonii TaxID=2138 RepID=UPI001F4CEB57|nr:hypothetical protein [Spiroplasma poulsonii]UNF62197.1 hypothetical protein MNU24_01650 [Spiroplasma poulsonii]
MAINKGYNDDIKLVSPYYFELLSEPKIKEGQGREAYYEFKDCIVQLKSSYFDFSDLKNKNYYEMKKSNIKVINNDISENKVYQLEANFFNWLSITNELETNNISSLIPAEIKLSDGEYGKYLTNLIISNDKVQEVLNELYAYHKKGIVYSKSEWLNLINNFVENNIKILFSQSINNLNQIEISGIWGHGNYDIYNSTEKNKLILIPFQLFNKK